MGSCVDLPDLLRLSNGGRLTAIGAYVLPLTK